MAPFTFRAKLVRPPDVGSWTYAVVPKAVSAKLPARGHVRVVGDVDGHAIHTTLVAWEGGHALIVKKDIRDAIGKEAGATVAIAIEATTKPVPLVVPTELKAALAKDKIAQARFDALAPSHRKEHAQFVADAKKPETRKRRAAKTVETLKEPAS